MTIEGKNFLVFIKGDGVHGDTETLYPIACDKTCSLGINSTFIETTTKDSGYFRNYLPSLVGWSISGNGLVNYGKTMGVQSLQDFVLKRKVVNIKMQAKNSENDAIVYSGVGYLKSVQISGNVEGKATFSYELQGVLELNIDNSIPIDGGGGQPNDDMAQVYRGQFIATNGQETYQNNALVGAELLWLAIAGTPIYQGAGDYQMAGLDPVTGTITWNYATANGNECIYMYKK